MINLWRKMLRSLKVYVLMLYAIDYGVRIKLKCIIVDLSKRLCLVLTIAIKWRLNNDCDYDLIPKMQYKCLVGVYVFMCVGVNVLFVHPLRTVRNVINVVGGYFQSNNHTFLLRYVCWLKRMIKTILSSQVKKRWWRWKKRATNETLEKLFQTKNPRKK